jgi:Skp family chaperone for outer membrane proteins
MGLWPWVRRCLRVGLAVAVFCGPALAQDGTAAILTLDQDRLFVESAYGKAVIARERAASAALEQENKQIEAGLVAEELALTEQRKTLPAGEFSAKAEAFDAKVEEIRTSQDAKAQVLVDAREKDRQAFLKVAVPILSELLAEKQAVAIIDKGLVILSLSAIDVTDEAIAKVDARLPGTAPAPAAP